MGNDNLRTGGFVFNMLLALVIYMLLLSGLPAMYGQETETAPVPSGKTEVLSTAQVRTRPASGSDDYYTLDDDSHIGVWQRDGDGWSYRTYTLSRVSIVLDAKDAGDVRIESVGTKATGDQPEHVDSYVLHIPDDGDTPDEPAERPGKTDGANTERIDAQRDDGQRA